MSRIGLMSHGSLTPPALSAHQLDTLRLYRQLGTYEGVADFRGVTRDAVANTLTIVRKKLGVTTTAAALAWLQGEEGGSDG